MIINKNEFIFKCDHKMSIEDSFFQTLVFQSANVLVDGITHTINVSNKGDYLLRFNTILYAKQFKILI